MIKMNSLREHKLAEFQQALRDKAKEDGVEVDLANWLTRYKLIVEESGELDDAVTLREGKAQELKELCDLLYVTYAAAYELGLHNVLTPAFNRVHENNMLKIAKGHFNSAGKLVKHPEHPKVDLSDLVENVNG